jgi:thiamine biosynthesis protein ThiS
VNSYDEFGSPEVNLIINGESGEFVAGLPLATLIEQLGMRAERVAVELNGEIVPRDRWSRTALQDGDRLEVVHFVGGG